MPNTEDQMERIHFNLRIYETDKKRWQNLVRVFPGKTYELFNLAVDEIEKKQDGAWEGVSPMQRAQAALVTLSNALGDISAETEKVKSLETEKVEPLKQRIQSLETYIDSRDKQEVARESQLLGEIHRLREDNKILSTAQKDFEALKAKYDILMRDRADLRRRIKKLEAAQD